MTNWFVACHRDGRRSVPPVSSNECPVLASAHLNTVLRPRREELEKHRGVYSPHLQFLHGSATLIRFWALQILADSSRLARHMCYAESAAILRPQTTKSLRACCGEENTHTAPAIGTAETTPLVESGSPAGLTIRDCYPQHAVTIHISLAKHISPISATPGTPSLWRFLSPLIHTSDKDHIPPTQQAHNYSAMFTV
jgi:hypothetical protein